MRTVAENNADDRKVIALDRKNKFTLYRELDDTSTKIWLVKNLLGEGEASAFYGAPGSGKSALIEDMGLHVAGGLPWHGRNVIRGVVCYIALERRQLVIRRAIAFRKKHGIDDLPFAIMGGVFDFRDQERRLASGAPTHIERAPTGVRDDWSGLFQKGRYAEPVARLDRRRTVVSEA